MLIPPIEPFEQYEFTGVDTLPIPFPFYDLTTVKVMAISGELRTELIPITDFMVTGLQEEVDLSSNAFYSGNITILPFGLTKLVDGDTIAIYRETVVEQIYQYNELDEFPAKSHENALGRLTVEIQELYWLLSRALIAPIGKSGDDYLKQLDDLAQLMKDLQGILDEMRQLADGMYLESGVYNVRASFKVKESVSAGSIITLPAGYFPKRRVLLVFYGGTLCTQREAFDTNVEQDEYSYEEIGDDINEMSTQIRVLFDMDPDILVTVLVVASAAGRNIERIEEIAIEATATLAEIRLEATKVEEDIAAFREEFIDGFDASKITSGTLSTERLPIEVLLRTESGNNAISVDIVETVEKVSLVLDPNGVGTITENGLLIPQGSTEVAPHAATHNLYGRDPIDIAMIGGVSVYDPVKQHAVTHDPVTGSDPIAVKKLHDGNLGLYVSATGNNSNDGLTLETAKATLEGAIIEAQKYNIINTTGNFLYRDITIWVDGEVTDVSDDYHLSVQGFSVPILIAGTNADTSKINLGNLQDGSSRRFMVTHNTIVTLQNIEVSSYLQGDFGSSIILQGGVTIGSNSTSNYAINLSGSVLRAYSGSDKPNRIVSDNPSGCIQADLGSFVYLQPGTIQIIGNKNYSQGTVYTNGATVYLSAEAAITATGTVTGRKYYLRGKGDSIGSSTAAISSIPGTLAGGKASNAGDMN